jgi:hypothetical protein
LWAQEPARTVIESGDFAGNQNPLEGGRAKF